MDTRRVTYLRDRTRAQRDWYTDKAKFNRSRAVFWRVSLISAEVVAVVLAAGRVFAGWEIDAAGILAALIGAGAAWLAVKQHSTLRAAYSLTAAELERQMVSVRSASTEDTWAQSVADAEEAISREHTMWLASRGEVNEDVGRPPALATYLNLNADNNYLRAPWITAGKIARWCIVTSPPICEHIG
ncbi:SLATT domain-containing protein [Microbacterium oxydans]|nr:SLATT domain-containing protein [Microbacterium oxydans]